MTYGLGFDRDARPVVKNLQIVHHYAAVGLEEFDCAERRRSDGWQLELVRSVRAALDARTDRGDLTAHHPGR